MRKFFVALWDFFKAWGEHRAKIAMKYGHFY